MRRTPERLVFIDETSVKTNLTRLRGRAPRGERLYGAAPFGAWNTQTFIAGAAFETYIRTQLAPALEPGTVVILDNLSTHKNAGAARALKEHGCWFRFLPPYSPDLNPIEMAYAKLKANLRRIGARTFDHLMKALGEISDLFSPQECWNYFSAAGYAPT
jgi:transposase